MRFFEILRRDLIVSSGEGFDAYSTQNSYFLLYFYPFILKLFLPNRVQMKAKKQYYYIDNGHFIH